MHIKNLGGQNHRYLRGYHTLSSTFFQPNTQGCVYVENWIDDFEYMTRTEEWGILTYTCHPYVIGRGHRMLMLERLLDALVARKAVFLTLEEAAREYDRRQPWTLAKDPARAQAAAVQEVGLDALLVARFLAGGGLEGEHQS